MEQTGTTPSGPRGSRGPVIGSAVSVAVVFLVALTIPLEAARELGLSDAETAGWILGIYGIPGVLALFLTLRFRVPWLLTGNIFVLILVSRVGDEYSWPSLIGATMAAGALIVAASLFGLTERLRRWLPVEIIYGLLAGAVFPFLSDMFTVASEAPSIVAPSLLAYLLAKRFIEPRVPAVIPSVATAIAMTAVTGGFSAVALQPSLPVPVLTPPAFELGAILALTPVMVVLISLQANVPSLVYLHEQGFRADPHLLGKVSGIATTIGSLSGPLGVSLSLPATALVAGSSAGPSAGRYRAASLAAASSILIGALAGVAVLLAEATPDALLQTAIGLALLGVFADAVGKMTRNTRSWGPIVTFVIAATNFTAFGLSSFFWAIAVGLATSRLLDGPHDPESTPASTT